MDEVGGAVVAIALVLVAVFVPTAFIPGISGQFYRQFALTIAVSTVHLGLHLADPVARARGDPAEAARSRAARPRAIRSAGSFGGLAGGFNRGFDRTVERLCARASACVVRRKIIVLPIYAGLLGRRRSGPPDHVPSGFIPALDQGYAIVVVQLPDGASLSRTDAVTRRVSDIARDTPGALHAVAFAGFSAATFTNATNAAAVFVPFKPFEERLKAGQTGEFHHQGPVRPHAGDRGGLHHRGCAAARARHRQHRRLQDAGAGEDRRRGRPRAGLDLRTDGQGARRTPSSPASTPPSRTARRRSISPSTGRRRRC